jgi:cellulose synthase operon protein C
VTRSNWITIGLCALAVLFLLPRVANAAMGNFVNAQLLRSILDHSYPPNVQPSRLRWAEETLFGSGTTQGVSLSHGYLLFAQASLVQGNLAKADEYFVRAISFDPQDRIAHLGLGNLNERLGRPVQALDEWRLAAAGPRKIGEAKRYAQMGLYADVIRTYEDALAIDPSQQEAYSGLALTYAQHGEPEYAAAIWRRALTRLPQWSDAYAQLGSLLYWQLSSQSEGLTVLQDCVTGATNPAGCYYYLGRANQERGDSGAAIRFFTLSTQLSPASGDNWAALGEVYFTLGKYDVAAEMYDRAASLGAHPVWRWLGALGAGRSFLAAGDYPRAVERLESALAAAQRQRVGPQYLSEILITLGKAYEAGSNFEQAAGAYQRTLEGDPGNSEAASALARLGAKQ